MNLDIVDQINISKSSLKKNAINVEHFIPISSNAASITAAPFNMVAIRMS